MSGGIASGMTDGTDRRHRHTANRKWNGIPGHAKKHCMPCLVAYDPMCQNTVCHRRGI